MILITGTQSGLGKHLHEALGGLELSRLNRGDLVSDLKKKGVDFIIHCAFNSKSSIFADDLNSYIDDNLSLLEELLTIPHKKFIYISSIDVYPKNGVLHDENEKINIPEGISFYGMFKLMAETRVASRSKNYLILRCSALLSKYSRSNSLVRLLTKKHCELTISQDSIFNYVLCDDIAAFIKLAIERDLKYTYNICASTNVKIYDLASAFHKHVTFGHFKYETGNIDNRKAISIYPKFELTSHDIASEFAHTL